MFHWDNCCSSVGARPTTPTKAPFNPGSLALNFKPRLLQTKQVTSIGVLFGRFGRKIEGDSWFPWWFNQPGRSIFPTRTPKVTSPPGISIYFPPKKGHLFHVPRERPEPSLTLARHGDHGVLQRHLPGRGQRRHRAPEPGAALGVGKAWGPGRAAEIPHPSWAAGRPRRLGPPAIGAHRYPFFG